MAPQPANGGIATCHRNRHFQQAASPSCVVERAELSLPLGFQRTLSKSWHYILLMAFGGCKRCGMARPKRERGGCALSGRPGRPTRPGKPPSSGSRGGSASLSVTAAKRCGACHSFGSCFGASTRRTAPFSPSIIPAPEPLQGRRWALHRTSAVLSPWLKDSQRGDATRPHEFSANRGSWVSAC